MQYLLWVVFQLLMCLLSVIAIIGILLKTNISSRILDIQIAVSQHSLSARVYAAKVDRTTLFICLSNAFNCVKIKV